MHTAKELLTYTERLLRRSSIEQVWTPARLNDGLEMPYGFGWALEDWRGHRVVEHDRITGTEIFRLPDDRLTVIALTNLGRRGVNTEGSQPWVVARGVAGLYDPALRSPRMWPARPDPDPETTRRLLSALSDAPNGRTSTLLTSGLQEFFAKMMSAANRAATAARLEALGSFTFLGQDDVAGPSIRYFGSGGEPHCLLTRWSPGRAHSTIRCG